MIHQLKTEEVYFASILEGTKSFEIRKNDRNFAVGDFLALNEVQSHTLNGMPKSIYTGRCCLVEIVYMMLDSRFVPNGYIALGIRPCSIGRRERMLEYAKEERLYKVPCYEHQTEYVGDREVKC